MKRTTLLGWSLLIAGCLMTLAVGVAAQRDDRIPPTPVTPNIVQFDPCLLPNPPPQCLPAPDPCAAEIPPASCFPAPDPRRGVSLGVILTQDALAAGEQSLTGPNRFFYPNAKQNVRILRESGTGWVRLWLDWPTFQPTRDFIFDNLYDDPRTAAFIKNLDAQVVLARKSNLKVILVVHHRFPRWANGTADTGACEDGCGGTEAERKECVRACRTVNDPRWKQIGLKEPRLAAGKVPADLGVGSPWGAWINFIVRHYGFAGMKLNAVRDGVDCLRPENLEHSTCRDYQRFADYLEVVNEPNLTLWPQWRDDKPGDRDNVKNRLVIANNVARMFKTAQDIVSRRNAEPDTQDAAHPTTIRLTGPGTADLPDPQPVEPLRPEDEKDKDKLDKFREEVERKKAIRVRQTGYDTFTRELLVQLRAPALAFNPKSYFAWSHHHYADLMRPRKQSHETDDKTRTLKDPEPGTNSAAWVRELLRVGTGQGRNKWTGYGVPNSSHPVLLLTEGGARLSSIGKDWDMIPKNPPYAYDPLSVIAMQIEQRRLLAENFTLMLGRNSNLRAGIGLLTQYLSYSDICSDSGLFDYINPNYDSSNNRELDCAKRFGFTGGGGQPRKVYDLWRTLRSFSGNPTP